MYNASGMRDSLKRLKLKFQSQKVNCVYIHEIVDYIYTICTINEQISIKWYIFIEANFVLITFCEKIYTRRFITFLLSVIIVAKWAGQTIRDTIHEMFTICCWTYQYTRIYRVFFDAFGDIYYIWQTKPNQM